MTSKYLRTCWNLSVNVYWVEILNSQKRFMWESSRWWNLHNAVNTKRIKQNTSRKKSQTKYKYLLEMTTAKMMQHDEASGLPCVMHQIWDVILTVIPEKCSTLKKKKKKLFWLNMFIDLHPTTHSNVDVYICASFLWLQNRMWMMWANSGQQILRWFAALINSDRSIICVSSKDRFRVYCRFLKAHQMEAKSGGPDAKGTIKSGF